MRMTIRTAMSLAMLAMTAAATAQISLGSAVALALRDNVKVKSAQAEVDKCRAQLAATHDAYVPSAGATGGYGTSTGVPLGVPVVFGLASNSLLFSFAQKDNIRAAEAGLSAANLALNEMRDQISEDVVVTYIQLNSAQQRQTVMAQESDAAARLVTIVQQRLDAGLEDNMNLLRARKTAKQIELQQLQLDDQVATLSDHLSRALGLPGNLLKAIPESIPPLPDVKLLAVDATTGGSKADSFGVQAAFATAHSKQELAFGESRYRFRPRIGLGLNYSRISTSHTDYTDYYPGFRTQSENAASIGIEITVPLYDRSHADQAHEAAADAAKAYFDAIDQRNLFQEGRFKLRRSTAELAARSELAAIDRDLAQAQLDAVLTQLQGPASSDTTRPQMTPKDEQNARLQERGKMLDLLDAQFQMNQAQVNLMRQTGQLDSWLHGLATAPEKLTAAKPLP
jgi:outer membrane protein TolC